MPHWSAIAGITDGLLVDDPPGADAGILPPSLEDCLLGVWQ